MAPPRVVPLNRDPKPLATPTAGLLEFAYPIASPVVGGSCIAQRGRFVYGEVEAENP
jgi:hypothetical protein